MTMSPCDRAYSWGCGCIVSGDVMGLVSGAGVIFDRRSYQHRRARAGCLDGSFLPHLPIAPAAAFPISGGTVAHGARLANSRVQLLGLGCQYASVDLRAPRAGSTAARP